MPSSTASLKTPTLDEGVPRGTVQSRIGRLHRLAINGAPLSPSPTSERERDSERSGWGTRFGVQARLIRPEDHGTTVEVKLNVPMPVFRSDFQITLPPRQPSIGGHEQSSPRTVTKLLAEMEAPRSVGIPTAGENAPTDIKPQPTVPPSANSPRTRWRSCNTTPTRRREAARELLDQYGISLPPGWLSDEEEDLSREGDGTPKEEQLWKLCHICGDKIRSGDFCSSCGHPLCRTCTCEVPAGSVEAGNSYATAKTIHNVTPHASRVKNDVTWRESRRTSLSSRGRPGPESVPPLRRPKSSLKNNPFIVADRIAKATVAEPQTSNTNIQAARHRRSSELLASKELLEEEEPAWHSGCGNPSCAPYEKSHHPFRHSIGCQMRQEAHGTSKNMTPGDDLFSNSSSASPARLTSTQAKVKRLYQRAEDLHHAQHIMEHIAAAEQSDAVHTDHGLHAGEIPNTAQQREVHPPSMPRVRAYSPPLWLMHPSREPGSVDGRLRRVESRSHLLQKQAPSDNGQEHSAASLRPQLRHHEQDGHQKPTAKKLPATDFRSQLKHYIPKPHTSPTLKKMVSTPILLRKTSERRLTRRTSHHEACENCNPDEVEEFILESTGAINQNPMESFAPSTGERESAVTTSPLATAIAADDVVAHRPTPVISSAHTNHQCSWKAQYTSLAAQVRQMKAERWSSEQQPPQERADALHAAVQVENDEVDIQGLTIVLHLRGKDDLVINTDLTHCTK
ncbi:hypothetical protein GQ53DRAFT_744258 [Thozetella sp. PMI_491]|nr:hypothetical protein GQ53DRAFT_744258 [Thozetella sp. PMI_491]